MESVDAIGNCFAAIKKHPIFLLPEVALTVVIIIIAIIMVVPIIIQFASSNASASTISPSAMLSLFATIIPLFIIFIIIAIILGLVVAAMYMDLASKWQNDKVSLMDSAKVALNRFFNLLLYTILVGAVEIVALLVIFGVSIFALIGFTASPSTMTHSALLGLIGIFIIEAIIAFILFVIVTPFLFTAPSIIVIENVGPISALKSSFAIGKKDFFGIIVLLVVFLVIYGAVALVSSILGRIPYIGIIFSLVISVCLAVFASMLAPMYYVTYGKSRLAPMAPGAVTPSMAAAPNTTMPPASPAKKPAPAKSKKPAA